MANLRLFQGVFFFLAAAALAFAGSPDVVEGRTDIAILLARQAPGTPQFECHSNCGNTISGGRLEGHCTNATWVESYDACLKCALEFDIWKHYGTGVTGAAKSCSLTPTPSPVASASGSSSSGSASPAPTASPTPTSPPTSATPTAAVTSNPSTAGAPALRSGPLFAGMLMLAVAL